MTILVRACVLTARARSPRDGIGPRHLWPWEQGLVTPAPLLPSDLVLIALEPCPEALDLLFPLVGVFVKVRDCSVSLYGILVTYETSE